ncbi:MAG: DUF5683 domain-containing protein [bacterium]|nr:DUF5683 domain-containing protein [bacterium]
MKGHLAIVILFLLAGNFLCAQTDSLKLSNDSVARKKEEKKQIYYSPRKAALMSMFVPGLGQVYNRKYYKVIIIHGVGVGAGYMFAYNQKLYNEYRQALIASVENPNGTAVYNGRTYTTDQLSTEKKYYKKYRDMAVIGFGLIYLLNIIDANVDAHIKTFDVSDDLGFKISPWQGIYAMGSKPGYAAGIALKLNFK